MISKKIAVVGGGFFGCWIAIFLAERGHKVTLLERSADLMTGASTKNQARLHGGYHYPRSLLTALACQREVKRFASEFESSVIRPKHSLYAIARHGSLISAAHFEDICERIGAPIRKAQPALHSLFSREQIAAVFEVEESVFDANELKRLLSDRLSRVSVEIRFDTSIHKISPIHSLLRIHSTTGIEEFEDIYVCLYDSTNELLTRSDLPAIPLEIEYVELALVKVPAPFSEMGITVMDGPFWSLMPYPCEKANTLSHVRYTPHHRITEDGNNPPADHSLLAKRTAFPQMYRDVVRFVPGLAAMEQVGSIFARKAILPRSAETDSRPIVFIKNHALQGLHVVVGAKIDTVFDLESEIQ